MKNFARNYGPYGITANAVAPGAVEGFMTDHLTPEEREHFVSIVPLGRFAAPIEVARVVGVPGLGWRELRQRGDHRRQRRLDHDVSDAGPRLRLGVMGAGAWAAFAHIPGFLRRREIEPWIVNRRDPEQLAALQAQFGFAHATSDWHEVIAARPDIVSLTGPVANRAEQALAALEAGIHVLAEKPVTVSPADAWSIDRLARDRGLHVVLCYAWNAMGIVDQASSVARRPGRHRRSRACVGGDVDRRPGPADRRDDLSRGRGHPAAAP
jgi:hypothetical protein